MHVLQELQTANLLAGSNSWHHTTSVMARCHHGAQQRVLHLHRSISPEQAHDILHHCGITRQCDLAIAHEAKLLLRHPQELAENCRTEVHQRDLKTPPVGSVHDAVALDSYRSAAFFIFFGCRSEIEEL